MNEKQINYSKLQEKIIINLGENMLYNIKMRSSKGGPHEKGGKHISGAERILREDEIEDEIIRMYQRALNHEKGSVDFINIKIQ